MPILICLHNARRLAAKRFQVGTRGKQSAVKQAAIVYPANIMPSAPIKGEPVENSRLARGNRSQRTCVCGIAPVKMQAFRKGSLLTGFSRHVLFCPCWRKTPLFLSVCEEYSRKTTIRNICLYNLGDIAIRRVWRALIASYLASKLHRKARRGMHESVCVVYRAQHIAGSPHKSCPLLYVLASCPRTCVQDCSTGRRIGCG